jgi:DNA-binding GntR family transcriptional regulator
MLPSEADISAEFGVARGTVRQALIVLEELGLIEVVAAKGRFVRGIGLHQPAPVAPSAHARQIASNLRVELASGRYADGDRFKSESELCKQYGVTRYAARQALAELEAAGLLVAVHARGRFVRLPPTGER